MVFALLHRFADEPRSQDLIKAAAGISAAQPEDSFYKNMGGLLPACPCHQTTLPRLGALPARSSSRKQEATGRALSARASAAPRCLPLLLFDPAARPALRRTIS